MKRIFAVNLGSTSTKVAYFEDDQCVHKDTITHRSDELAQYRRVFDQTGMRKSTILDYLNGHGVDLDQLDAFVSRGGQTEPIPGGTYLINQAMLDQVESGRYGVHVCAVGCRIAYDLTRERRTLPLTVDTPSTDEFAPLARYSGLKEISRVSCFQALNHKAMARHYAHDIGRVYEDLDLVVVMLGGGISVVAHHHGQMIDGPDALEGEGPFSNNRCGTVPAGQLVKLCYSGTYDLEAMMRHINGEAGLVAYLGTTDLRQIEHRITNGDTHAAEILDAMCYQTAKEIGAMATVLKGHIDAIVLTGGMANSHTITDNLTDRVGFLAPVITLPGEREMESLCLNALHALTGTMPLRQFIPKETTHHVPQL